MVSQKTARVSSRVSFLTLVVLVMILPFISTGSKLT